MMRKIILFLLVYLFVLFAGITTTYAYWNISNYSMTNSLTIGEWFYAPVWEPNPEEPYEEGDVVYWEGNYYVRTGKGKGNQNAEPGNPGSWNFWDEQD
jgi:signal peptidase I